MRITCPNCTSGFDIPTELLGRRGRTLKCATCGHGWFQAAVVDEIDLADVMNESSKAAEPKDTGGTPSSRRNVPDTAAIAAAANQAFTQAFGKAPPKPDTPPPPPQPAAQPAQQQPPAVPPGAQSIMSRRKDQFQQQPASAQSMMSPEEAAEAMSGSSLMEADQAGAALDAQSLMGQEGGTGAPGQSVVGQETGAAAPAAAMEMSQAAMQQGVAGGAPGAQMVQQGGDIVQASAEANPLPSQVAQQPPRDPSAWLNQDADADDVLGVAGMPGMPGMPGGPGGAAPDLPPAWSESMMDRDRMQGPGAAAVSQLTGEQVQAPGQAARSMLTGDTIQGPGLGSQSMLTGERSGPGAAGASQMGQSGGPGAAGVSQMGEDEAGPGQGAVSLLDGTHHDGQAREDGGASAEGGVSGGPGGGEASLNELLGEDGEGGIEDDLFENEDGGGEDGDLEGGVEGGISGGPGGGPADNGDDAGPDGEESGDGEEDDDLVDPDEDTPDFAALSDEDEDIDDLDDDPLADFEEEKPQKKKKKKKMDPAYVTAAVLSIVVLLLASLLYAGRDQLSEMWPALKGVYEALSMDETPGEGLRLSQPQPSRMIIGGVQTLVVNGFITNLTETAQPVPNIKLMLVDENNNIVQETSSAPSASTIDPNSSIPYRIELQLPVDSATGILVEFD